MEETAIRSGFVAVAGRPNAGKSSLVNWILKEKISLVSKKANATRKRSFLIHMYKKHQIIFIDTPGIHEKERLLNQFMLKEALKAIGDCDVILFLAPASDSLREYEEFLALKSKTPHIILLTKTDTISNEKLLKKIKEYQQYQENFQDLIPISIKKGSSPDILCEAIIKYLPIHPYLYDSEILTTQNIRDIYKEFIREAIFEKTSEELPYFCDVLIEKVEESEELDRVFATIVTEKTSQKGMLIGKGGRSIKRIGKHARELMEELSSKKIFLNLEVIIKENWTKNKENLTQFGYFFD